MGFIIISPGPVFVIVFPLIFKLPILTVPVPFAVGLIFAFVTSTCYICIINSNIITEISLFVTNPSGVSVVFVALFVTKLNVLLLFANT